VDIPYGAPGREGTAEVVREKFRREASRTLPEDRIDRAIVLVEDFETSGLIPLLDTCCIA
jgi:2-methylcitrate dehydratase PrpD